MNSLLSVTIIYLPCTLINIGPLQVSLVKEIFQPQLVNLVFQVYTAPNTEI